MSLDQRKCGVGAALVLWASMLASGGCGPSSSSALAERLAGRRAVLVLGGDATREWCPSSVRCVREAESTAFGAALRGTDARVFAEAMGRAGIDGVLVETSERASGGAPTTLRDRLRGYESSDPLRAVFLDAELAYYELEAEAPFEPDVGEALARVARLILSGQDPPPITAFPEALRRIESVEMMVLVRENGEARLWRSARASSVARSLTTAATTARDRWKEREVAMGGPLASRLASLDVEVYAIAEDGTLLSRAPAFVDRVFTPEHGVAYERRGASWKYSLPSPKGTSAVAAYAALFESQGLPKGSLGRADLRLYRMRMRRVGASLAHR